MRINTNIPALQSYNALTITNNALAKSINRLSTGLRINGAADDAAGLAISEKMRAQYRGLDQAQNNAQDGISMIQTAEGALNETHSILQRMRELSVQAANDTLTQEDRSYIQLEIDQLKEEIDRISTTTQFNKKQLLDGSAAAVWSSSDLTTRAIVNGGLREIDQFGQKKSSEGNYKITVKATPGEAEVQKSDIFKIKHKNVIMDVQMNAAAGVTSIRVDNIPAAKYSVLAATGGAGALFGDNMISAVGGGLIQTTKDGGVVAKFGQVPEVSTDWIDFSKMETLGTGEQMTAAYDAADAPNGKGTVNLSLLFEVESVNAGAKQVTFKVQAIGVDVYGNSVSFNGASIIVGTAGVKEDAYKNIGLFLSASSIKLTDDVKATDFAVGAKFVAQRFASTGVGADVDLVLKGEMNTDWEKSWVGNGHELRAGYSVKADNVQGKEVHFKQFYLNTENGTVHEGDVAITFDEKFTKDSAKGSIASFEAAYIGQIAKGDVALRDIDKFWDANGKFMLEDPKTLTVVQGDGTKASVTLYSTDTIGNVRSKLNDAIASGLGQGRYATDSIDQFVTFVEPGKASFNTSESVAGTFVIRSLIPGAAGKLTLSGDEDVIKAFSLNIIQESKESKYEVSINDAHSGNVIASGVKVTGNKLVGVLHDNVDIVFDSMANTTVNWNDDAKKFVIARDTKTYETILHISDNTTVFQIGANQGEDMSVDIGSMSSESLGVNNIIVSDRESAARSITKLDNAINRVSRQRAKLGAYQNRLEHTINNLTTASTNLKSSESRIRDADMAKEMMEFTKLNILSQAGNSMLAQANQLPQNVLSLLR